MDSGHSTGMDLTVVLENIEHLLRVKKMSANKASTLAGKPDAIRNIQRKLKGEIPGDGIAHKTLEALAKVLGTTADELQKPNRVTVQPISGVREKLLEKINWLDRERAQAIRELEALAHAEMQEKSKKRRARQ